MMADFQIEQFLDDQARASAQRPTTAAALLACPPAMPQFEQRQLLHECVGRARAAGLRLPRLHVDWVMGRPELVPAAIRYGEGGQTRLALSVLLQPRDLAQSIFHELQHASDFVSGRRFAREEWEVRAERFAREMMRQW